MFKALIVDDERIVRSGIRNSINWNEYGIEMIAEAENGVEALDQVMADRPDLILLDICMPRMDGLEFAGIVKKKFPSIHIVIITGFNDFEYARNALRAGVDDYILKPVNKEIVSSIVSGQIEQLKKERDSAPPADSTQNIRTSFSDIFSNALDDSETVRRFCDSISMSPSDRVRIVYLSFYSTDNDILGNDDALARFSVANIADEILESSGYGRAITAPDSRIFAIVSDKEDMGGILLEILDNIYTFLRLSVTLAVSDAGALRSVRLLREQAVTARDYAFASPETPVIYYSDIEFASSDGFLYPMDIEQALLGSITSLTPPESAGLIDRFCTYVQESGLSEQKCKNVLWRLSIGLADAVEFVNVRYLNEDDRINYDAFQITLCRTMEEARCLLTDTFRAIYESTSSVRSKSASHYEKICRFIDDHYGDSSLNLKKCSEFLFLSCGYINMILKKETDCTFVDLLNKKRIAAAQDLLRTGSYRVNEVAGQTGFSHPTYFSTLFKKQTGMSPKEFMAREDSL